jgi:hypothetical protein
VAKTIQRLLTLSRIRLTVVADGGRGFQARIRRRVGAHSEHLRIVGGNGDTSAHLRQCHLVLTPDDGDLMGAALVMGRPMIAVRRPADRLGADLGGLRISGIGAVARKPKEIVRLVRAALKHRGYLYRRWLRQIERWSQPV